MRFAHRRRPMDNRKRLPTGRRLCPQGPPAYPLHVDNALRAPARRAFAHIPLSRLWICTIRNQSSYISDGYARCYAPTQSNGCKHASEDWMVAGFAVHCVDDGVTRRYNKTLQGTDHAV